jgi:hypothetical protein
MENRQAHTGQNRRVPDARENRGRVEVVAAYIVLTYIVVVLFWNR